MYGEARTQVKLANLVGNETIKKEFMYWQEMSRSVILNQHWNPMIQSFAVIPMNKEEEVFNSSRLHQSFVETSVIKEDCQLDTVRLPDKPVNVRELLAFMPFYFDDLIPNKLIHKYLPMWKELFDINGFSAPWGLRTTELRHPCYNYSWDHGDCWNGPSWPYETSRVLSSAANILNKKKNSILSCSDVNCFELTKSHYWQLLLQYACQHTRTYAVNDTAVPLHSGHIFENLHPDLGYWNNRARMYWRDDERKNMGDDYNHSTFIDLILNGLLGIRPQEDGSLVINPLVQSSHAKIFAVDHVKIGSNRILSITWSDAGSEQSKDIDDALTRDYQEGLTVFLDGQVVARRKDLGPLHIDASLIKQPNSDGKITALQL